MSVEASAAADGVGWVEVTRRADPVGESCVIGVGVDPPAVAARVIVLRAPAVPRVAGTPGTGVAPDAGESLERYFDDLGRARFEDASARFSRDTIYAHPPYTPGAGWVLFRGREALCDGWRTLRGPSPARQIVTGLWQMGGRFFAEGIVEGIPDGGSFVATGQLTQEGEIARYLAFYSRRRIPGLRIA